MGVEHGDGRGRHLQKSNGGKKKRGLEWNRKQQDKHVQAIDLLEGIVLETGAGLIKWKVILTHRGKLFANIHHWPLKKAQRFLSIPQHFRSTERPVGRNVTKRGNCMSRKALS